MTHLFSCSIIAVIFITQVVSSSANKTNVGETKDIYLLCVCVDYFYHILDMSSILEFSLEVVNNRSDIIRGYTLHIVCEFSTTAQVGFA